MADPKGFVGAISRWLRRVVPPSAAYRRLLTGTIWTVVAAGVARMVALGGTVAVARLLGLERLGDVALVQSTLSMIGIYATLGLGITATKKAAELRVTEPAAVPGLIRFLYLIACGSGALGAAVMFFSANLLAQFTGGDHALGRFLAIASLGVLFSTIDGFQTGALLGIGQIRALNIASLLSGVVAVAITLPLAMYWGVFGAVAALPIISFLQSVLSGTFLWVSISRAPEFATRQRRIGWREGLILVRDYAIPSLILGAMVMPTHWLVQTILAKSGNGHAQVALFAVAFQWFQIMLFIPAVASRLMLPILTDTLQRSTIEGVRLLRYTLITHAVLAVPLVVMVVMLSPTILSAYGAGFSSGWPALALMSIAGGLVVVQSPLTNLIFATNRFWMAAALNAGWAIAYVTLTLALASYGAAGAAFALAAAYSLHTAVMFFLVRSSLVSDEVSSVRAAPNRSGQV